MYPVLIVDDERLIREGLATIVDWEAFGFYIVGTAADAQEALGMMAERMPKLLIVDIRMPGMNGFELLHAVQQTFEEDLHVLILSGHADFEYARAALQLKVDGYLLKPLDEEELMEHLRTIHALLAQRSDEQGDDPSKWIQAFLARKADVVAKYGQEWDGGEVVLIKPLSREEVEVETAIQLKQRLCASFLSQQAIVFHAENYLAIAWPRSEEGKRDYQALHKQLQVVFDESALRFDVAAGGGMSSGVTELTHSFKRAEAWMRVAFWFGGKGNIMSGDPPLMTSNLHSEQVHTNETVEELEQRLYLSLDAGHEEMVQTTMHRLAVHPAFAGTEQEWKTYTVTLLSALLSRLTKIRPECRAELQTAMHDVLAIQKMHHFLEASPYLVQVCSDLAQAMPGGAGPQLQIQRMIEWIERHSAEHLRLETLAEMLGYNSSYLGKLFRSTTGVTFNTFLDQVRIKKAKQLLNEGKKVYQVAELVGYANADYFHAKFRKYEGVSPSVYRKQHNV